MGVVLLLAVGDLGGWVWASKSSVGATSGLVLSAATPISPKFDALLVPPL